jgi:PKD repeat protein
MKSITIYSRPTASLKVTGPRFPGPYYVNETITFDASESSDRDGYITSYRWIFGDGTPQAIENDSITTHAYTSEGTYTPTLWVTDNDTITSLPSTIIPPIKVESGVPVANFTVSPKPEYYVCKTLTFDASSSNPKGGYIVNYTWNFDDGNITTVSAPIIIHHYNESRTYLVILTVTDNYTITSPPFQILVHVYRRLYIADYIYGNAEIVYNPGQAFKVNVTVAGATDLYSYQFNFTWSKNILNCTNIESAGFLAPENFTRIYPNGSGYAWVNGTRTGGGTGVNGSGTLAIISFTVLNTGKSFLNFSYAALINSTGGGINFALVNGTFYTSKPAAYFEPSKRHGVCNETITFDASKSYDPDGGDIIIYHWYWGDGTYTLASLSSTTHAYKNPENYTVTLKVIDDDGETWNFTDPMEIEIVLYGDVAVNEVESLRNETAGILNITVTVTNKGNITQAFNITIYYDSTPIKTPLSSSVTNPFTVELPANASRTVTFMWDIVNNKVPRGNYTIKAVTSLPEGQIDRNPLDNEKSEDHTVKVRVRGDLNDDHVTDISDLVILVGAMPSIPGSPKWYQYADLNCDNKVDINDLIIVILLIPSFDS